MNGRAPFEWHFEDFTAGETFRTMSRTVTEFDVRGFIGIAGFFEEVFIDSEAAMAALGRAQLVPGYLTLALAEGLYALTGRMRNGMGLLGLDKVRWTTPVAVGDGIYNEIHVTEVRASRSRRDRGIVWTSHEVRNREEVPVMSYRKAMFIGTRAET